MPRIALLVAVILPPLAFGLGSCGRQEAATVAMDAAAARAAAEPWGFQREFVALTPPSAAHGRWDDPGERRQVVSLLPRGDIQFRGKAWVLAPADEAARLAALAALRTELDRRAEGPQHGAASEDAPSPFVVHADRRVRWRDVLDVMRCAVEEPVVGRRLRWTVVAASSRRDAHQEATLSPLPPTTAAGEQPPLALELSGRRMDDGTAEVRLVIGGKAWITTDAVLGDDGPGAASTGLAEARSHLEAIAPDFGIAELRLPDHAPDLLWGHVVATLDLVLGAGLRRLDVPQLAVRLSLAEPDDLSVEPQRRKDDPVLTPLILVLSALALLVVFTVTLAPTLRLRRRAGNDQGT